MQNIIVTVFEVESEGYQAMTELKKEPGNGKNVLFQAVLIKKENGQVKVLDHFDTGLNTADDTAIGGLVGMFVGILGGPIGMLLGAGYGAMTGMLLDTIDATDDMSLLEQISEKLGDGTAVIGLAEEEDEGFLDAKLGAYKTVIARFDAAVVAQEVEAAREMQTEMERQARADLRKQKTDEFKGKVEAHRTKIKEQFENIKANHS